MIGETVYKEFPGIRGMPVGWTWLRPDSLGVSEEEGEALQAGSLPIDRAVEIGDLVKAASRNLLELFSPSRGLH
jgi:hypothetical protein